MGWIDVDERKAFLIKPKDDLFISSLSGIPPINTQRAVINGATLTAGVYRAMSIAYITTDAGKVVTEVMLHYVNLSSGTSYNSFVITSLPEGNVSGSVPENFGAEIYLARDPVTGKFNDAWGSVDRPLEYVRQGDISGSQFGLNIDTVQFGPTINLNGYGFPLMVASDDDARAAAPHGQRFFFVAATSYGYPYTFSSIPGYSSASSYSATRNKHQGYYWQGSLDAYSNLTVGWTEQGFVNLYNPTKNYYTLPAKNSTRITAFVSIQDGLLVFCDNESFLMRGDPSFVENGRWDDFNFMPYMPVGCDYRTIPGILGPEVYVVWRGEVYRVSGGQLENISKPVFDRTDKFTQVVGDAGQSAVMCLTKSGNVFAFYPEYAHWTQVHEDAAALFPGPERVYISRRTERKGLAYITRPENTPTLPVTAQAIYRTSLGDKHRRKMLKRIRLPVSTSFTGDVAMTARVDQRYTATMPVSKYSDEYVFVAPLGLTGYQFEITISFTNMRAGDVIEGPINFEYVDRGQKR